MEKNSVPLIKVSCAKCGSFETSFIVKTPDYEAHGAGEFEVARCTQCGFVYTAIRPESDVLFSDYYPDDYLCYGAKSGSAIADCMDKLRTQGQLAQRTRYLLKNLPPKKPVKMLEVGCGTGKFLKYCKNSYGFEVWGVEPNNKLCSSLKEQGINIINSTFEKADLKQGEFDVICLFHVIEHLWDGVHALKRLNTLLRKDGILFMEFPNFDAPARKFFGKYWFNYHQPRHLIHLDMKTVRGLAQEIGFSIVDYRYEFRPTINAMSIQYALHDKIQSRFLRKIVSIKNPLVVLMGIGFEVIFNVIGKPSTLTVIMRKTAEMSGPVDSLMREKKI